MKRICKIIACLGLLGAVCLPLRASLKEDVEHLSDPLLEGRRPGTRGSVEASVYIMRRFQQIGLQPKLQFFLAPAGIGRNVYSVCRQNPKSDKYVLICAHYDGLGVIGDNLYPCADSNASGVAVMLYLSESLSDNGCNYIFAALDAGQIDLIVNEVGYTEERAEKYDFSEPYAFVKAAILTRADDDSISSFEDLEGRTVANESTSLWGERALSYGANLDPVNAMAQSISEVLFERADATLNAETAFADYISKHPEDNVKIAALSDDAVSVSYIPMVKGNEKLMEAVNAALDCARKTGELSEVSEKYFHVDVTEE